MENISVAILSPSSVKVSWTPPLREFWNGIITSYTVISHSYGPNNFSTIDSSGFQPTVTVHSLNRVFPIKGNKWGNNADPRFLYQDVVGEEVMVEELQEYFTYKFTVYMTNSAGDSDPVTSSIVQLPGIGMKIIWEFFFWFVGKTIINVTGSGKRWYVHARC